MPECTSCGTALELGVNWTEGCFKKHTYKCSPCRAEYQRQHYQQNKEKHNKKNKLRYEANKQKVLEKQKFYTIKKQYGLSEEEYKGLMENASCAICNKDNDLVIDHCHVSGSVRGVLCRQCNCALGLFQDNTDIINKAKEYLSK